MRSNGALNPRSTGTGLRMRKRANSALRQTRSRARALPDLERADPERSSTVNANDDHPPTWLYTQKNQAYCKTTLLLLLVESCSIILLSYRWQLQQFFTLHHSKKAKKNTRKERKNNGNKITVSACIKTEKQCEFTLILAYFSLYDRLCCQAYGSEHAVYETRAATAKLFVSCLDEPGDHTRASFNICCALCDVR